MRMLLLLASLSTLGCGPKPAEPTTPAPVDNRTLFVRLGGQPAINAVVHEFVVATKADPRISQYFTNTDPAKLEKAMDDHICSITGGGCTYTGKPMLAAHTGMKLRPQDFDAFMEDLAMVLHKLHVPGREGKEVIDAFTGMKPDVVGH